MGKKISVLCLIFAAFIVLLMLAHAGGTVCCHSQEKTKDTDLTEAVPEEEDSTEADILLESSETETMSVNESLSTEADQIPEMEEIHPLTIIDPTGMTLLTRIHTPVGYERTQATEGSLGAFLRAYPMKEDGAPVLMHDGSLWSVQYVHAAVFDLPLEYGDYQQCADSVMRVYAEYFWSIGKPDKIAFYFTTGFLADYATWRDGYRIRLADDEITFYWTLSAEYDDSYENFVDYLRYVFIYASTFSMDVYEAETVSMDDLQIGDVYLKGGNPGHVVMVVDICYDENGNKAFLLADGHTPAMEFHLLKNPLHEEDPWFYEDEIIYPFETFAEIYEEEHLQRLNYLEIFGD